MKNPRPLTQMYVLKEQLGKSRDVRVTAPLGGTGLPGASLQRSAKWSLQTRGAIIRGVGNYQQGLHSTWGQGSAIGGTLLKVTQQGGDRARMYWPRCGWPQRLCSAASEWRVQMAGSGCMCARDRGQKQQFFIVTSKAFLLLPEILRCSFWILLLNRLLFLQSSHFSLWLLWAAWGF